MTLESTMEDIYSGLESVINDYVPEVALVKYGDDLPEQIPAIRLNLPRFVEPQVLDPSAIDIEIPIQIIDAGYDKPVIMSIGTILLKTRKEMINRLMTVLSNKGLNVPLIEWGDFNPDFEVAPQHSTLVGAIRVQVIVSMS